MFINNEFKNKNIQNNRAKGNCIQTISKSISACISIKYTKLEAVNISITSFWTAAISILKNQVKTAKVSSDFCFTDVFTYFCCSMTKYNNKIQCLKYN
jgi:hypothetical protein